jgi:hypothetical protein
VTAGPRRGIGSRTAGCRSVRITDARTSALDGRSKHSTKCRGPVSRVLCEPGQAIAVGFSPSASRQRRHRASVRTCPPCRGSVCVRAGAGSRLMRSIWTRSPSLVLAGRGVPVTARSATIIELSGRGGRALSPAARNSTVGQTSDQASAIFVPIRRCCVLVPLRGNQTLS